MTIISINGKPKEGDLFEKAIEIVQGSELKHHGIDWLKDQSLALLNFGKQHSPGLFL